MTASHTGHDMYLTFTLIHVTSYRGYMGACTCTCSLVQMVEQKSRMLWINANLESSKCNFKTGSHRAEVKVIAKFSFMLVVYSLIFFIVL